MTLTNGDHLVLKRKGVIFTPDVGEAYHEFEVMGLPLVRVILETHSTRLF